VEEGQDRPGSMSCAPTPKKKKKGGSSHQRHHPRSIDGARSRATSRENLLPQKGVKKKTRRLTIFTPFLKKGEKRVENCREKCSILRSWTKKGFAGHEAISFSGGKKKKKKKKGMGFFGEGCASPLCQERNAGQARTASDDLGRGRKKGEPGLREEDRAYPFLAPPVRGRESAVVPQKKKEVPSRRDSPIPFLPAQQGQPVPATTSDALGKGGGRRKRRKWNR